MSNNSNFTIFVNTSDSFEDCWYPFFKLLKKFWQNEKFPQIVLNTEYKNFQYEDLPIICTKVNMNLNDKLNWSQCFKLGLKYVETDYLLYLQEDYFINKPININIIRELLEKISKNDKVDYLGLTDNGSSGPFFKTLNSNVWEISKKAFYLVSCQAAIWKKDSLMKLIYEDENPWMFEIFGSIRAKKRNNYYLTINRERFPLNSSPIIGYVHTGIIKGKWNKEIPNFFKDNNIEIDYSKRGFFRKNRFSRVNLALKLIDKPILFSISLFYWLFKNNKLIEKSKKEKLRI